MPDISPRFPHLFSHNFLTSPPPTHNVLRHCGECYCHRSRWATRNICRPTACRPSATKDGERAFPSQWTKRLNQPPPSSAGSAILPLAKRAVPNLRCNMTESHLNKVKDRTTEANGYAGPSSNILLGDVRRHNCITGCQYSQGSRLRGGSYKVIYLSDSNATLKRG